MEIPGDWYSIDFHVHSPASRCFEMSGNRGKDEEDKIYTWLLEQAIEANLDIIAITDHNDVRGYERLLALEAELNGTRRTLNRSGIAIPDDVQHQIDLFSRVTVLPGVELDVYPNVHLLILFDPLVSLAEIDSFLDQAGYLEDVRGKDTACRDAKWNMQAACQQAAELGAIALAAHVDSDKGLYEASKKWGQQRIAVFTEETLYGMEFVNPVTRDQLEKILASPDYARETRLSFVQSSDFHGHRDQQIGERRTYVRLDGVKPDAHSVFEALKKALRNPAEYVSAPERPEIRKIQNRLDGSPCVSSLNSHTDIVKLCRYVCAFGNSEDGTVVVGRTEKGNWVGAPSADGKDLGEKIKDLILKGVKPTPSFEIEIYPQYGSKFFATVRVRKGALTCSTVDGDRVYLIEKGKLIQASTDRIVQLTEDKFLQRYARLSVSHQLAKMSQRLGGIRDSIDILPLVRKVESQTKPMARLFPFPRQGSVLLPELGKAIDFEYNGVPEGNVIVLESVPPRLESQYIRLTAPMGQCDLSDHLFDSLTRFDGEKILVAPEGAVYLDSQSEVVVTCRQQVPIILQAGDDYTGPSVAFFAAYLKSAVAIWYADRCLGSTNFYNTRLLSRVPVPSEVQAESEKSVLELVDQLRALEQSFLASEVAAIEESRRTSQDERSVWGEERKIAVDKHNKAAAEYMAKLDKLFFDLLELTAEEVGIVQEGIRASGFQAFDESTARVSIDK